MLFSSPDTVLENGRKSHTITFKVQNNSDCFGVCKMRVCIAYMFLFQQIAFKNLVQRNRELEKSQGTPSPNSAIQLPYIIVNTSKKTVIDCSISKDK